MNEIKDLPPAVNEVRLATGKCPSGHNLPHATAKGECTPLYCALPPSRRPKAIQAGSGQEGERADLATIEDKRLRYARDRAEARRRVVPVPEGLTGAEAESYVTRKLIDLTPLAVAELEYQLALGDDGKRYDAARDILDRSGFGKRENAGGGSGPVVVINMPAGGSLPWINRVEKVPAVIERQTEHAAQAQPAQEPAHETK